MRRKLPLLLMLLVVLAVGVAYREPWARKPGAEGTLTLYGNVDIRKVDLGFRVPGRIAEMPLQEGARAASGDLLARLDATPYGNELELALAQEAQAAARLAKLEAGSRPQEIAQAEALVRERQARADNLEVEYGRLAALLAEGAVPHQSADDARANLAEARARLTTAREGLKLAREGFRREEIAAARADLRAARARVALARTRLSDSECRAPDEGVILTRVEEPGAVIAAGQTVLTLALDTPAWIRAYVEEPDLGRIRPGMTAEILTDSRPEPYAGHIGYISPEAEFTPKTVQTEELRTKLVYQLRVIAADPDHCLRQGMPVTVRIPLDAPPSPRP